jgi:hypothetical protein
LSNLLNIFIYHFVTFFLSRGEGEVPDLADHLLSYFDVSPVGVSFSSCHVVFTILVCHHDMLRPW